MSSTTNGLQGEAAWPPKPSAPIRLWASSSSGSGSSRTWLVVGGGGVLLFLCLIMIIGGAIWWQSQSDQELPVDLPLVEDSPSMVSGTSTPVPTFTPANASATDTPSPSASATPTREAQPPTLTPTPEETLTSTPPVEPTATILYPDGRPLTLFYDAHGFYVWNSGDTTVKVELLDFEALDEAGVPLDNRFEGWRWSQYYPNLERGNCVRIEVLEAPAYPRPVECQDYNAEVSFQLGVDPVFWVEQPSATEFRVLWDDQEVGKCQIDAGSCSVFLPPVP